VDNPLDYCLPRQPFPPVFLRRASVDLEAHPGLVVVSRLCIHTVVVDNNQLIIKHQNQVSLIATVP
jgi:hypothetical protein